MIYNAEIIGDKQSNVLFVKAWDFSETLKLTSISSPFTILLLPEPEYCITLLFSTPHLQPALEGFFFFVFSALVTMDYL